MIAGAGGRAAAQEGREAAAVAARAPDARKDVFPDEQLAESLFTALQREEFQLLPLSSRMKPENLQAVRTIAALDLDWNEAKYLTVTREATDPSEEVRTVSFSVLYEGRPRGFSFELRSSSGKALLDSVYYTGAFRAALFLDEDDKIRSPYGLLYWPGIDTIGRQDPLFQGRADHFWQVRDYLSKELSIRGNGASSETIGARDPAIGQETIIWAHPGAPANVLSQLVQIAAVFEPAGATLALPGRGVLRKLPPTPESECTLGQPEDELDLFVRLQYPRSGAATGTGSSQDQLRGRELCYQTSFGREMPLVCTAEDLRQQIARITDRAISVNLKMSTRTTVGDVFELLGWFDAAGIPHLRLRPEPVEG